MISKIFRTTGLAVVAVVMAIITFIALAPAPVVDAAVAWALTRNGSTVAIASDGQVDITPKSGKTTVVTRSIALNGGATVPTAQTVAITDADALTVNSVIVPQFVVVNLGGMDANSISGDQCFIANRAYQVVAVRATWSHVGGSGAAATVEKLTGTTAPGSGTAMLTAAFDLTGTANTVGSGTLSATASDLQLAAGNRLGVKLSGTLTALTGLNVTVYLKAI